MKFGLFHSIQWPEGTEQRQRYREALAQATYAEEIGLESLWLTEHHFSRHGIISDNLNVLSYLAAETERIRLGTAVAVLPFHNPVRLAEAAATVDLLSDGRLDLGVGRGYQWSEFHGFSVTMDERASRFDEAIGVIVRSWRADAPFSHHGRFWQYDDIDPQPKPLQRPHPPIWVATESDEGFRRCAAHGWGVMLPQGRSLGVVADQVGRYRRVLSEMGIDYDPMKLILARALHVGFDDRAAWEEAEVPYRGFLNLAARVAAPPAGGAAAHNPFDTEIQRDSVIFGGPETCASSMRRIQDLGVEYVIFFVNMGELAHQRIMRSLRLFAEEVVPRLTVPIATPR
jgi:probable F420-dependent oxidoreductase